MLQGELQALNRATPRYLGMLEVSKAYFFHSRDLPDCVEIGPCIPCCLNGAADSCGQPSHRLVQQLRSSACRYVTSPKVWNYERTAELMNYFQSFAACADTPIMICKSCVAFDLEGLSHMERNGDFMAWCFTSGRFSNQVRPLFPIISSERLNVSKIICFNICTTD